MLSFDLSLEIVIIMYAYKNDYVNNAAQPKKISM